MVASLHCGSRSAPQVASLLVGSASSGNSFRLWNYPQVKCDYVKKIFRKIFLIQEICSAFENFFYEKFSFKIFF